MLRVVVASTAILAMNGDGQLCCAETVPPLATTVNCAGTAAPLQPVKRPSVKLPLRDDRARVAPRLDRGDAPGQHAVGRDPEAGLVADRRFGVLSIWPPSVVETPPTAVAMPAVDLDPGVVVAVQLRGQTPPMEALRRRRGGGDRRGGARRGQVVRAPGARARRPAPSWRARLAVSAASASEMPVIVVAERR